MHFGRGKRGAGSGDGVGNAGGGAGGGSKGVGLWSRPLSMKTGVTILAGVVMLLGLANHLHMAGHQSSRGGTVYGTTSSVWARQKEEAATDLPGTMSVGAGKDKAGYQVTTTTDAGAAGRRKEQEEQEKEASHGGASIKEEKKQSLRQVKPPIIVGSDVDLDAMLERTKAKLREEEAERVKKASEDDESRRRREEEESRRREEEERKREEEKERKRVEEEEARRRKEEEEEEKRKREEEERKRKEQELLAEAKRRAEEAFKQAGAVAAAVPPVQLPTKVLERLPITDSPVLHRNKKDVKIERILFLMSTIDRGQRIGHWGGDKLETIVVILETLRTLCERGFDMTLWMIAAWKASDDHKTLQDALYCKRIERPIHIKYWDHFPPDIGGDLSHKHRLAVKEAIDDYDFFISGEDDILITPQMFDAFLDASYRLAGAADPNSYYPGFARKEHDKKRDDAWSLWETDADDYKAIYIPGAGYFASVSGNTHQAMWMGTREQLYHFDKRCDSGFFNIQPGPWVEFWSGALQLWDYCKGLRKVIPIDTFRDFTVWHMTDTKLYVRGKGVAPVEGIVKKLEEQRRDMEATQKEEDLLGKEKEGPAAEGGGGGSKAEQRQRNRQ